MSQESHVREEIRKQLLPIFEQLVDTVVEARRSADPMQAEQDIAQAADRLGAEAIGQWLVSHDIDARHIEVDRQLHYRMSEPVEKTYHTRRGRVRLLRHVYRPSGEHNGKIVCPLEVGVGMVGGQWTPGCAEAMAYVAQELPERAAAKVAQKMGAMDYSHNSFKRVARTLGERWEADRDTYEEATIEVVEIPDETQRLAVSIDRVSLLIDEEDALRWRMAYCGTLTLYDGQGEPLKTLRYGRMPGEGAHILREQMKWDVAALTERGDELEVVALSDGAAELCNILDEDYPEAARYIDYYHLIEKISAALTAFCNQRGTTQEASEVLAKWKTLLLNEPNAIEQIEQAIKRWRADDIEVGGQKPVHHALTYIANHKEQMNYAQARAEGHPIGSGHVEACCKQLVQTRMKRNGQRWKPRGGQSILTLRSLATDARWEEAMQVMMPSFRRRVEPVAQAA
jgi:hypothetical protein